MDENVSPTMSPIYLGIWMTSAMMGPALGFTLGGAFLKIYTDVDLVREYLMDPFNAVPWRPKVSGKE